MSPSFKAEWTVYGFDLEKKSFQIRYASKWLDCEIASDAWSCKNNSNEKMSFKQNKDVLMREHIYRVEDKGEGMEITVHYPCKFVTCSNLPNKKCPDRYMKLMQTCACCSFPNSAMLVESLESLQKSRAVCAVGQ
jgi:hypothetical protein